MAHATAIRADVDLVPVIAQAFAAFHKKIDIVTVSKISEIKRRLTLRFWIFIERNRWPIPNDHGIGQRAAQVPADLHDSVPLSELTIPPPAESHARNARVFAYPSDQLRVIILQPINRVRAAALDTVSELDGVRRSARRHNYVAMSYDVVDIISKRTLDRRVLDESLRETSATSAVMLEVKNRYRRFVAFQRSVIAFSADKANIAAVLK